MVEATAVVKTATTIASFAGLSVPPLLNNTTIVLDNPSFDATHMIGVCPAIKMACSQQQKTILPDGIFDPADQMNICNYIARMGIIQVFSWNASQLAEAVVGTWRVNPGQVMGGGSNFLHTPLSFISGMFRLWRGGMRYRLAISKTRFHSGTLEIIWQMGLGIATIASDYEATNCYRAIWDIQQSSSFELEVPFVCSTPWASVLLENNSTSGSYTRQCQTGFLSIRVVNPLGTGLGQVTDAVDILIYACGDKDFEFAVPGIYGTPEIGGAEWPLTAQAGGVFQDDQNKEKEVETAPLKMAQANPPGLYGTTSCVGESVDNMRLLSKRFGAVQLHTFALGSAQIAPWRFLYSFNPYVNYLSNGFAYFTGGVRLLFRKAPGTAGSSGTGTDLTDYYNFSMTFGSQAFPGAASVEFVPADQASMTVEVPYQNLVPYLPVNMLNNDGGMPYLLTVIAGLNTTEIRFLIRIAAGDDFEFGFQVGPPTMVAGNQTSEVILQYNNYT